MDSFLQLLVMLQLAYRRQVNATKLSDEAEKAYADSLDVFSKYKLRTLPFKKALRIIAKNKANGGDGNPTDEYKIALLEIKLELAKNSAKWINDPTLTPDQHSIAKYLKIMFSARTISNIENQEKYLEPKLHILKNTHLRLWYAPAVKTDQREGIEELHFLVKKWTGRVGNTLTAEEMVEVRKFDPVRFKRYMELRSGLNMSAKAAVRLIIRESGKDILPVPKVRKALLDRGVKEHGLPTSLDSLYVGEDNRFYTSVGNRIDGMPMPGSTITMNPKYDPRKDDEWVFQYKVPNSVSDRPGYAYTEAYKARAKTKKFEKVQVAIDNIDPVRKRWISDLDSKNAETQMMAVMSELLYTYAMRIGGKGNKTAGESTYGLSTLTGSQVRLLSSSVKMVYPGKKSVLQTHVIKGEDTVSNKVIALLIKYREACKPSEHYFSVKGKEISADMVRDYLRKIGSPIMPHTMRNLKATVTMQKMLTEKPLKATATQAEAEKHLKDLATKIGAMLGHWGVKTPDTAKPGTVLKNYLDPQVCINFFQSRDLRVPAWVPKKG